MSPRPGPGWLAAFDRAVDLLIVLSVAISGLVLLLQVGLRYLVSSPLPWPEELATLAFAWMVFLGAARAQRDRSHLAIDLVRRRLSPTGAGRLDLFIAGLVTLVGVVLIWQGLYLAWRTWPLAYPAMGISRAWLYLAVPAGFALALLATATGARRPDDTPT